MSFEYEIFTDMSIDVDPDIARENGLKYIPMEYVIGEDVVQMTEPESFDSMMNFYERLRHKDTTHTSQITPQHYIEAFEPYLKKGRDILYFSLSSGLSKTYDSACLAREDLLERYPGRTLEVVDSLGATIIMGLMAESAFANRKAGMSVSENAEWLRQNALNIDHYFKVTDLFYLMRGGRVSAPVAVMGAALNLKPILIINGKGSLETEAKKRGDAIAMKYILSKFQEEFDPEGGNIGNVAYICSAGAPNEAQALKDMILEVSPETKVRTTMLCPVIGAHTGPDMLALAFYGKKKRS